MQSPSLTLFSILHRLDVSGLACHCLDEPKLEGVVPSLQASIFNDSMDIVILPFENSIWNSFCCGYHVCIVIRWVLPRCARGCTWQIDAAAGDDTPWSIATSRKTLSWTRLIMKCYGRVIRTGAAPRIWYTDNLIMMMSFKSQNETKHISGACAARLLYVSHPGDWYSKGQPFILPAHKILWSSNYNRQLVPVLRINNSQKEAPNVVVPGADCHFYFIRIIIRII